MNQIEFYKREQKNFWKLLGELAGNNGDKSKQVIDKVYYLGMHTICSVEETANIVNYCFATVGDYVAKNIDCVEYRHLDPVPDTELFEFKHIDCNTLFEIVKDFEVHKSSGSKNINSRLMLDARRAIPDVFVKLINLSLRSEVFPDEMKVGPGLQLYSSRAIQTF